MSGTASRSRLDVELVRRGLARSRDHAAELIANGRVRVDGRPAAKPATPTSPTAHLDVHTDGPEYVSRGGHKLAGALADLRNNSSDPNASASTDATGQNGPRVEGRRCLDAGASTGGFTDVLLRAGAAEVVAVDVGHGQLVDEIRNHPAVRAYEGVNIRDLTPDTIGGRFGLVVADLSFISLRLVLPALHDLTEPDGDLLLLVKPQFEVGRERLGRGGVVKDDELRAEAVRSVAAAGAERGLGVVGTTRSRVPGPSGNVEFFLWLRAGAPTHPTDAGPDQDPGERR